MRRMGMTMAVALAALMATASADARRPVRFAAQPAAPDGTLVLPLGNAADLATRGATLDAATRAGVERALAAADFAYTRNAVLDLRGIGPWRRILVIGTGTAPLDARAAQQLAGVAARQTAEEAGPVTFLATGLGDAAATAQLGVGSAIGDYRFTRYKPEAKAPPTAPFTIVTADPGGAEALHVGEGAAMTAALDWTRDIVTEPSNVKYPEVFVQRAQEALRGVPGVRIEALDVPAMQRLNMGSLLSVGQGSQRPPRLLIVEYRGGGGTDRPIALLGKGITFDSGGNSIKPATGMWLMKTDMAGAAAVVGAVMSLARSRAPVNVVAIAALAENMPGGGATRPGDVVTAHNGKTIEILNTDAEGRLVLADAVAYAESRYRPEAIVDAATLTGAIVSTLGSEQAGLFTRHSPLGDQLMAAGRATGEGLWRLPLRADHASAMNSDIADIRNVVEGGTGGASTGAHFIGYFAKPETPWAHLDIAGTAWSNGGSAWAPAGATASGVRLLDRFVRDYRPVARRPDAE